ncbi:MAG TPA: FGGY family carbohydrate kinase, partial [Amaricoccus sp.]|nr:FGGY family carbohydrate kinase [Amaricoccus sp.]
MPLVAAIDVGTASARAGIFDAAGTLLGRAEAPLETREADGRAEQSSDQIWQAAAAALRAARAEAGADPAEVAGLAFDATTSLVLLDAAARPVSVSTGGDDRWNVIPWHDHRATPEADACTATAHPALAGCAGAMHPEMPLPKLMWQKRALPASWARAGLALDLTDFLAFRATGNPARSHCTLTCKWTWTPDAGWDQGFLAAIGLPDLVARTGQPARATPIAADLGPLTAEAAASLGLTPATRVAAGLIDAHAGALGVLGHLSPDAIETSAALIAGTSSAVMAFSRTPRPAPGLWGPYPGGTLPGLWLTEGGQSASGALLDHVLRLH